MVEMVNVNLKKNVTYKSNITSKQLLVEKEKRLHQQYFNIVTPRYQDQEAVSLLHSRMCKKVYKDIGDEKVKGHIKELSSLLCLFHLTSMQVISSQTWDVYVQWQKHYF